MISMAISPKCSAPDGGCWLMDLMSSLECAACAGNWWQPMQGRFSKRDSDDLFGSEGWGLIVGSLVLATCLSIALGRKSSHLSGILTKATSFSSRIPKLCAGEAQPEVAASTSDEKLEFHPPQFTGCQFFIDDSGLGWVGYVASAREWRLLPPLKFLPDGCTPDTDLYKQFQICAHSGLVCGNFSKRPDRERLIVFNPESGEWTELPPLTHRRNPVLLHMREDPVTKAYQVLAAGCDRVDEDLSHVTEVFDSATGQWTRTGDVVGPHFAINEFQSGVYHNGRILCIGFVQVNDHVARGIMAYDVEQGTWSSMMSLSSMSSTMLQLLENNGEVFLFSEWEGARSTEHRVDRVEWPHPSTSNSSTCKLSNVVQKKSPGGRSLEAFPEHVLVPYAPDQVCILNIIDHTGVVHNTRDPNQPEFPLPPADALFRNKLAHFALNPISFPVELKLSSKVHPVSNPAKETLL